MSSLNYQTRKISYPKFGWVLFILLLILLFLLLALKSLFKIPSLTNLAPPVVEPIFTPVDVTQKQTLINQLTFFQKVINQKDFTPFHDEANNLLANLNLVLNKADSLSLESLTTSVTDYEQQLATLQAKHGKHIMNLYFPKPTSSPVKPASSLQQTFQHFKPSSPEPSLVTPVPSSLVSSSAISSGILRSLPFGI